jgi:hypothetical protein
LIGAIARMQPWPDASKSGRRVLHEPGKQILVYGGGELDLAGETGDFRVKTINPRTGETTSGEMVAGGTKVTLPNAAVVWLTKE